MTLTAQNSPMTTACLNHGFTALPDWGLILVEGPDAVTLLQSQLSNSVLGLKRTRLGDVAQGSDSVRLVGYCSPKGRLLASAWLGLFPETADSDDRFALFVSKDIAASTAKRLSMYVLRSKVKVVDASDEWEVFGTYQNADASQSTSPPKESLALRMPDVQQRFAEQGAEVVANTPEQMGRFVRDEAAKWQKVIRDSSVTVD